MYRRNLSSRSPAEVLLPEKWRKKFAFLSPHVGCPAKAFLDHASISKLYPWAKTSINCSNNNKMACERPPLCNTAAPNITHSAIGGQDYSMHVGQRAPYTVTCPRCAVVRRWPVLCICMIQTLLSVARTCALLRFSDSVQAWCSVACT